MLYSSRLFVCRRCLDLAYACQQESEPFRLLRKAQRLHRRLGGDGALDFGFYVPKPKGMHWRTYRRLIAKGERAERAATLSMFHSLGGAVNLEDLIG